MNSINTHEKLLRVILEQQISITDICNKLQSTLYGYEGNRESIAGDLLGLIYETSAYNFDPRDIITGQEISEDDYFNMLAKKAKELIYNKHHPAKIYEENTIEAEWDLEL